MSLRVAWGALLAVGLLGLSLAAYGQNSPAGKAPKTTSKPAPKSPRGRLPDHYGKLALSDEQREKVYTLQAQYEGQIQQLERQLAELKAKEQTALLGVLTTTQIELLEALQTAAEKQALLKEQKSAPTSGKKPLPLPPKSKS